MTITIDIEAAVLAGLAREAAAHGRFEAVRGSKMEPRHPDDSMSSWKNWTP